jgi:hypothetical protein
VNVGANKTRLAAITKELAAKWQETKNFWTDSKCDEFERKYIEELIGGVDKAMTVMDRLDKLSAKIKSDCE